MRIQIWGASWMPPMRIQPQKRRAKMFTSQFGLEVEFTGITRQEAAETAAHYLGGTIML